MRNPYFKTPPVVQNLIIANCVLYLAIALIPAVNHFCAEYLQLWWSNSPYSPSFHSYQFVTYMFLHSGFYHLFGNMFALWMFGRTLEYELGSQRFLTYYMVCGIGAALLQLGVGYAEYMHALAATGPHGAMHLLVTPTVGASGAVFGLLLAYGMLHPNNIIMLMFPPIALKAKWFVVIYGVLELMGGVASSGSNVAHFAHLGGMLFGIFLILYWKKKGRMYY
jgi:membrane associated rhomboid family serine protease